MRVDTVLLCWLGALALLTLSMAGYAVPLFIAWALFVVSIFLHAIPVFPSFHLPFITYGPNPDLDADDDDDKAEVSEEVLKEGEIYTQSEISSFRGGVVLTPPAERKKIK